MYQDIKEFLETLGYSVKAEVLNTDITAVKDDEVIIVEMKKTLNTRLMYQGCKRQALSDYVYLAIPKPTKRVEKSNQFKEKLLIIKRLELGLIYVDIEKSKVTVQSDPKNYQKRRNNKKKKKLLKEWNERVTTFNTAGVTKTKIITAYREQAITIAYYLKDEPLKLKTIKELSGSSKCASILQKNFYGWFERVDRGIYALTPKGCLELEKYNDILNDILKIKRD